MLLNQILFIALLFICQVFAQFDDESLFVPTADSSSIFTCTPTSIPLANGESTVCTFIPRVDYIPSPELITAVSFFSSPAIFDQSLLVESSVDINRDAATYWSIRFTVNTNESFLIPGMFADIYSSVTVSAFPIAFIAGNSSLPYIVTQINEDILFTMAFRQYLSNQIDPSLYGLSAQSMMPVVIDVESSVKSFSSPQNGTFKITYEYDSAHYNVVYKVGSSIMGTTYTLYCGSTPLKPILSVSARLDGTSVLKSRNFTDNIFYSPTPFSPPIVLTFDLIPKVKNVNLATDFTNYKLQLLPLSEKIMRSVLSPTFPYLPVQIGRSILENYGLDEYDRISKFSRVWGNFSLDALLTNSTSFTATATFDSSSPLGGFALWDGSSDNVLLYMILQYPDTYDVTWVYSGLSGSSQASNN